LIDGCKSIARYQGSVGAPKERNVAGSVARSVDDIPTIQSRQPTGRHRPQATSEVDLFDRNNPDHLRHETAYGWIGWWVAGAAVEKWEFQRMGQYRDIPVIGQGCGGA
jgi:hypothetical protein